MSSCAYLLENSKFVMLFEETDCHGKVNKFAMVYIVVHDKGHNLKNIFHVENYHDVLGRGMARSLKYHV